MKDADFVAFVGTGEVLHALQVGRGHESVVHMRERHGAVHLRADGLLVVVVEHQLVDVAGEVFDIGSGACSRA